MHYDPRLRGDGIPQFAITALVLPRPIGWISTLGADGVVNLAPYSFFNAIAGRPAFVMFASSGRKDSQHNAETSGEFVANLATFELREHVNATSATVAPEIDEAALCGLEMAPSINVRPPRVLRSPIALECVTTNSIPLTSRDGTVSRNTVIIGEVVGIYIDDAVLTDGRIDVLKLKPISRLGYDEYALTDTIFNMKRPD